MFLFHLFLFYLIEICFLQYDGVYNFPQEAFEKGLDAEELESDQEQVGQFMVFSFYFFFLCFLFFSIQ